MNKYKPTSLQVCFSLRIEANPIIFRLLLSVGTTGNLFSRTLIFRAWATL